MADERWLLDTSILIDVLRGYKPAAQWVDSLLEANRFVSVITAAELLAGCKNLREQRLVEKELELYSILWLDEAISQNALTSYQRLRLSHNLGFFDCLIANTVLKSNLQLATHNLKHFSAFSELEAIRPY